MPSMHTLAARKIGLLALATTLTVGAAGSIAYAQSSVPETVAAVGCTGSVGQVDTDAETDDDGVQNDRDGQDDNDPAIVGSVAAPRGAREDDSRLASLATISPDQAQQAALAALNDASQRNVGRVKLEAENGYVVYAVETRHSNAGPSQEIEVKVDAGNGSVLAVECDANDD